MLQVKPSNYAIKRDCFRYPAFEPTSGGSPLFWLLDAMKNTLVIITSLLVSLIANPVIACHVMRPDPDKLDRFETIFLGEVTGIRLIGHENKLLGRPDGCEIVNGRKTDLCFNLDGGNQPVVLFAVPRKVVKGKADNVQELQMAGCAGTQPKLKERVLFFVHPKGSSAITVWESDKQEFDKWMNRLGFTASGI